MSSYYVAYILFSSVIVGHTALFLSDCKPGGYSSECVTCDNHISFNNMIRSCFILGLLNTIVSTTSRNIHWSSSICDSSPILDDLHWRSPICDSSFILSNLLLSLHTVFFCHLTGMDKGGSIKIEYKKNGIIYYNFTLR